MGFHVAFLRLVELKESTGSALALAPGHEVWVAGEDEQPFERALVAQLVAAGVAARFVGRLDAVSPRSVPVGGLVIVAPAESHVGPAWSACSDATLARAFEVTKALAGDLRSAGRKGGAFLATVARLDGAFGLTQRAWSEPAADPIAGGLAGIAKTARDEWPEVRCRALDVARSWSDPVAAATSVVRELSDPDAPVEVGLDAGARRGLELAPAPAPEPGDLGLLPGDVVLVTGGARGVTAETALALALAARPTLVLLGRTPEPGPEPAAYARVPEGDETALKQAVAAELGRSGTRPSPKAIGERTKKLLADREVRRNLARLGAATRVVYRALDVRDPQAVEHVVSEVRRELGPIRGLVHGAGAIEDKRIEEKTAEQFERVVSTKVEGLRGLLEALAGDDLRHLVLFSSVSGRSGRRGQVDYAVANEVLNKVAQRESRRRPKCRVSALGWGPWEAGMVSPQLKTQLEKEGVALIGLEQGGRALVEEMSVAPGQPVEVILGGELTPPPAPRPTPISERAPARRAVAFERTLDLARHPFLRSHVLAGRPVLPVAAMVEWLAHGALHGNPGLVFHGLDDLRVLRGVVLDAERAAAPSPGAGRDDGARAIRVVAGAASREGSLHSVPVELRGGPLEAEVLHARATIVLAATLPPAPAFEAPRDLAARPYPRSIERAYDEVLFHGAALHGLDAVLGMSPRGIVARAHAAPAPAAWMSDPVRSNWLADPLVLDAAFQLAILWCQEERGAVSLPSHLARYRQYRGFPREGVTISWSVLKTAAHSATGDFCFVAPDGDLVARLEGYECTLDPSLGNAFRSRRALLAT